jgi:trans-aconitate methyltransferase
MPHNRFDARFYQQFYGNPHTRVTTREEMERRARAVGALVAYLDLPVRRILDAGCGLGWMRKPLLRAFPKATYTGLEVSEHLCARLGWINQSLADFRPRGRFDLVICYDVLQYLPEREARRAMLNLARVCRGALYFHAPTSEDWQRNADVSVSDADIHLRDGEWYRKRLGRSFHALGFGMHIKDDVPFAQWELERVDA